MPQRFAPLALLIVLLAVASLPSKPLPQSPKRGNQPYFIPLLPKANMKLTDALASGIDGNNLAQLPKGEQAFAKKLFNIEDGFIHLSCARINNKPTKVEGIQVNRRFAKLHILHGTCFGGEGAAGDPNFCADGALIGEYTIHFHDKSTALIPVTYGKDVRDWHDHDKSKDAANGILAWQGTNEFVKQFNTKLRLYVSSWENPHPGKLILGIDYHSTNTVCSPFCIAMTAE